MAIFQSAKVTLNGEIQHTVRAGELLVVAVNCADIGDTLLRAKNIKTIGRGTVVLVKDITDSCLGDKTIRAHSGNTLYYLNPIFLTLPSLI